MAIFLTALIPVVVSIVLARSMVRQSSERFFVPEIGERLEQALATYGDLARELKHRLREQATSMSLEPRLLRDSTPAKLGTILAELRQRYPEAISLELSTRQGRMLARDLRVEPLDESRELPLQVNRSIPDTELELAVLFAVPKERFEAFQDMGGFIEAYDKLKERRVADERSYLLAFAVLLGISIIGAIGVGTWLARSVVVRVMRLARATQRVGAGDLSIRVQDDARDELGELAGAFNRMLEEVDASRNRIEYLSRLASWQQMARRLAHEIKNPLTPIQLAVQELHERLRSLPAEQRELLDTTREIVESEVGALRRLVGEFSEFARLPEIHKERADLFEFLRELRAQSDLLPELFDDVRAGKQPPIDIRFEIPDGTASVSFDRHMLRRVLVNLVRNGVQAAMPGPGIVRVSCGGGPNNTHAFWVDDSGPGIAEELRLRVFEPYFTTKDTGTGLGLAIVKKIILEHGGSISVESSELGGARFAVCFTKEGR